MGFPSVLTMAQRWVAERAAPGAVAIDATAGGGVDALFLAQTVGPRGRVYAFDVQQAALDRTRDRLAAAEAADVPAERRTLAPVALILAGHERMADRVPEAAHGQVRAVMFNLGYLPGGEGTEGAHVGAAPIITRPDTTLPALEAALALLAPGGALTVVVYPGHAGGSEEAAAVDRWAAALPSDAAQAVLYRMPQKPSAPFLYAIEKKG
ncbi:tRNA (mnm(5)s(2)U34)-methyltransferase [Cohnella nanjingensis]|uniref:SAM-dependent methyltransferase n=1 Tax=Cohnella nanjingensis TaxID=1387779 RepID=A0A7X0RW99_9BACL|nr:class I SAM-dependent methyltransferase [Cohnella nanjingensis]MBB6674849.1 SAM-dependent methyltransferase [Cohnella nanjingensis]